jgi:AraC family transcriptional regulator of adaptative response / DNA-3-methyladenine glycosylase II
MENDLRSVVLDRAACYAALLARDSRFDGRFFTGVSSTGIYCRPVCRVKTPGEKNCVFFISAAAAEAAGYRPCLKCRPELAPGLAPADAPARIARRAAFMLANDFSAEKNLAGLARVLGISGRHLRRVFFAEYGVRPVQYSQTLRLLLAKNLLTDTALPVTEVAMTAGFGSIRRFNDLFKKKYRLAPGRLRKDLKGSAETPGPVFRPGFPGSPQSSPQGSAGDGGITLLVCYRPPYEWKALIDFLAGRAIPGVEAAADNVYRRTVVIPGRGGVYRGWISVAPVPGKNSLALTVPAPLAPVLPKILSRVRLLFDTDSDPLGIYEKLSVMNELAPGLCAPGIRLPGCFDPFEMSVRAILGQQITVKAARTLAARLAAALGEKIRTPFEDLYCAFPGPEQILNIKSPAAVSKSGLLKKSRPAEDRLGALGITGARSRSVYALAEALSAGTITLSPRADPEAEMGALLSLPGFGPWTVQYIGMRALSWPDAFPHTDYGIKKALGEKPAKEILALSESWRPWRSYAAINLWNSLRSKG